MERILFSIVITTFNRRERLLDCVLSVINDFSNFQKNNDKILNFEIVIIDDGFFSGFVISDYFSKNVRYYLNNFNHGANYSRLKGIILSKGEFIVFLDDDDLWLSGRVFELFNYHCLLNSDFHFANFILTGSYKSKVIRFFSNLVIKKDINFNNFLGGFSVFSIRRNVLISNLCFINPDLKSCQDWFLYINLFQNKSFKKSFGFSPTIEYKVHQSGNITSSISNRYFGLLHIKALLDELSLPCSSRLNVISEILFLRYQMFGTLKFNHLCFIFSHGSFLLKFKLFNYFFK